MAEEQTSRTGQEERPSAPLGGGWSRWLLLLIPATLALHGMHAPQAWLFIVSALAIVPLAGLISAATEELAGRLGPGIGGLLNATFGNATELIIGFLALKAGMYAVAKASISGSIISSVLLITGVGMAVGGWGREKQSFSATHVSASAGMLFLGAAALLMPAVFDLALFGSLRFRAPVLERLSLLVAAVLLLTYAAGLFFSLRTHRQILTAPPERPCAYLPLWQPISLLALATVATSYEADVLVGAVSGATRALGITQFFIGIVVVALVGNAAEHYTAIVAARRDEMDLALSIALSSAAQIALFVGPVLVFASYLFLGRTMTLIANPFEIAGITLSVLALAMLSLDGESNWFEGVQLVALYLVLAIVFFLVPG